jgi:hypothetical protein
MYQVLDDFVNHPGWPNLGTKHLERFDVALYGIVKNEQFEPTAVGGYIEQKYTEQFGPEVNVELVLNIRRRLEERADGIMVQVRTLSKVETTLLDERKR